MKTYAVKHKNKTIIMESRSGGVFTAISDYILDYGVVYGCILNEAFEAVHIGTTNIKDRNRMRGSKYVQSMLGDCFLNIKNDLESGRQVLFTGTSCQVAGLKRYLGINYENLICVDIVCHGVPSPAVWKEYLRWISKNGKIESVDFRNKKDFGWREHVETIRIGSETKNSRVWKDLFYSNNIFRPACYECQYKTINHPGDITIADYWGIEKTAPEFDDNKGVSLVMVNTEKGTKVFEKIKKDIEWKETRIEESLQRPLIKPEEKPKFRGLFWNDLKNRSFDYIVRTYTNNRNVFCRLYVRLHKLMNRSNNENNYLKATNELSEKHPVLWQRKEDCCGCTACYSICQRRAIQMLSDEEGFKYPYVETKKCVLCNKCIEVCPIKNEITNND